VRWRTFRADRLTRMLVTVRNAVKQAKPSAILSAAVVPDAIDAAGQFLQDWRGWLDRDLLDVVCPMAYTTDAKLFAAQIAATMPWPATTPSGRHRRVSIDAAQIVENVQAARRVGVSGIILFSYDSLAEPARGPDYLAQVGRAAFAQ